MFEGLSHRKCRKHVWWRWCANVSEILTEKRRKCITLQLHCNFNRNTVKLANAGKDDESNNLESPSLFQNVYLLRLNHRIGVTFQTQYEKKYEKRTVQSTVSFNANVMLSVQCFAEWTSQDERSQKTYVKQVSNEPERSGSANSVSSYSVCSSFRVVSVLDSSQNQKTNT